MSANQLSSGTRFERLISAALAGAAVLIAVAFAHREFTAGDSMPVARGEARHPERVTYWADLLKSGTLLGNASAPVKIVEFGDFECPFCANFEASFRAVHRELGDSIALVFIHYPLERIHRFALPAARAAECGRAANHFAEYHDALYEKHDSLGLKSWTSYAIDAGIRDTVAFAKCITAAAGSSSTNIDAGRTLAARWNIRATPAVFVNGWRLFVPPPDSEALRRVIDAVMLPRADLAALKYY